MIHRFRVQNFKSLVDVDVNLTPVTVLVGRSGTGKSNFVQAIRFLRDVLVSNAPDQPSWPQLRPTPDPGDPTSFLVEFSVTGVSDRFKYELTIDPVGLKRPPTSERLDMGERCLFHQVSNNRYESQPLGNIRKIRSPGGQNATGRREPTRWEVEPSMVKVPGPGPIALGRIPSITEVVIAFTALTSGIGCYAFFDRVLCQPRRESPQRRGLADDGSNYLDVISEITMNLQDLISRKSIVAALQRVNPSISSVELNDIQNPASVVVGHRLNGKTLALDLSQESDGLRRFYANLLALYQKPPKQTLIFEHPEDGIHPGALSMLAEEFQAAPNQGRGQVILTTHSPQLLDHFDVDQIRVVELHDLKTRIGTISAEQKEAIRDGLLEPGELLTVDPARIQAEATGA